MVWSRYDYVLAIVMVVAGSANIIISKWTDRTPSVGRDGESRKFNHPFLQCLSMFFAEMTWLFAYKYIICYYQLLRPNVDRYHYPIAVRGDSNLNPLWLYIPAVLDIISTSLTFIGLTLTYASSVQMLRGSLIIFTGLLSDAFLKNRNLEDRNLEDRNLEDRNLEDRNLEDRNLEDRNLKWYQWLGIFVIIVGLVIISVDDLLDDTGKDVGKVITGDLIILIAQIVVAVQYVFEEKYIREKNVSPFQAIGWEGFFGFVTLTILLIPMYYIKVGNSIFKNPDGRLEDAIDAFYQMRNCWKVSVGFCGGLISLAFFNISGISVTQQLSATTRTILDSLRTFGVWLFSVLIGWQLFTALHLIGFGVLIIGMCFYEDILFRKWLIATRILNDDPREPVVNEDRRPMHYGTEIESSTASCSSAENGDNISPTRLRTVNQMG